MGTGSTEHSKHVILQVLKLLMSCRTQSFIELIIINQICLTPVKGNQQLGGHSCLSLRDADYWICQSFRTFITQSQSTNPQISIFRCFQVFSVVTEETRTSLEATFSLCIRFLMQDPLGSLIFQMFFICLHQILRGILGNCLKLQFRWFVLVLECERHAVEQSGFVKLF